MADGPPPTKGEGSSGAPKALETRRQKRMEFDSDGNIVERWVDVVVSKPKEPKKANPLELYKEFVFPDSISVGDVIPTLKDTTFDAVTLKKAKMVWLGKDASTNKTAGLWLETDVEFRGLLQPISDVLSDVFGQQHPGIHLCAHLGLEKEYTGQGDELKAKNFTLCGSIEGINRSFGEFLMFRNAGIMIHVAPSQLGEFESMWSFLGTLHLNVPNSVVPLVLGYKMEPKDDTLDISMNFGSGEKWESVFGVSGLNLEEVQFNTSISKKDVKKSSEFSISAKWTLGSIPVELTGSIKKTGSSLKASIKSLSLNDLRKLFSSLTDGASLDSVEQDVRFNELTIEIANGRLALYGEVWVDSYKVAAAEVLISVDGICISGAVDDIHIGESLHVKEAQLELIVGRVDRPRKEASGKTKIAGGTLTSTEPPKDTKPASSKSEAKGGTPIAAIVRGKVNFQLESVSLDFEITAAVMKPADGPLSYFVYGQFDAENLSIGKILTKGDMAHDHPMNLALDRVTLIACSGNDVTDYGLNVAHYPVKSGVYLCAELGSIPYVEKISKDITEEDRYVLYAGYSKESGLNINIILPENIRIELSPEVVSGPLLLIVQTEPSLAITFQAVLFVTPDGQEKPLELRLSLAADEKKATGSAIMLGWWENPLDLSPRLKIGPELALSLSIDYQIFLASGMPSAIGFLGGFVVDDIDEYNLGFNLGSNPKDTLVTLKVSKLNANQVINLINAAAELDIRPPKEELIRFEDVNIYASPFGCLLGSKIYPPGFAIQGKAFIYGKKVEIDCSLGTQGMKLKGEIEGFNLGPLTVKGGKRYDGSQEENARIDFEITKARQHFEVNGSIALWTFEVSVFVLAEVLPDPQLEFNFQLSWSDLIKFQVAGKLIKDASDPEKGDLSKLQNADFELYALMEQRVLTEVSVAMKEWFNSAQVAVHQGIDEGKRKVDEAKKEFDRKVEEAKKVVQEKQAVFNQKMNDAQASLKQTENEYAEKRMQNERWIIGEEKKAQEKVQTETAKLGAAQKAFQDDMDAKKRNLTQKKREGEDAINAKIRELQDERIKFQKAFGNAIQALQTAESRLRDEQSRLSQADDELNNARRDADNASWYEVPFKKCRVAALEIERFGVLCALQAAEMIVRGAKFIVEGVGYNGAMAVVSLAEGALDVAKSSWGLAIAGAQELLDGITGLHAAAIEGAKALVRGAESLALDIKKAAYATRDKLLEIEEKILAAAREVVKKVAEGIDYVAFHSALLILDAVQKDTTLVDIAKAGLDAAEKVAQTALVASAWLAERLQDTLNIELVELKGSLRAISGGGAFTIRVKGIIFGRAFDFHGSWSPLDTISYIIAICQELWEGFSQNILQLFKENKMIE